MKDFIGFYDGTMTEEKAKEKCANALHDGLMSKEDKIKLDKLKTTVIINNETMKKDDIINTSAPLSSSKFIFVLDNESLPNGHSVPVYKDKNNGKKFVAKIIDLDIEQSSYIEKVFKFEIVSDTELKYLGGMKIITKNNTITTENIDSNTFYILGTNV